MDILIHRLEALHRRLRDARDDAGCDPRVVEALAKCLRELHAIAAQSADPRLMLVDSGRGRQSLH